MSQLLVRCSGIDSLLEEQGKLRFPNKPYILMNRDLEFSNFLPQENG